MKCLRPHLITIAPKTPNSPPTQQWVPCGKCYACKSNKRNEWSFRLQQEQKFSSLCLFVTLTYDDDNLPYKISYFSNRFTHETFEENHPTVSKRDVQLFLKRYRKELSKIGVKLRYFLVSEYGPKTHRPHYHAIFFYNIFDDRILDNIYIDYTPTNKLIYESWNKGFINTQFVGDGQIHYVTKYSLKMFGDVLDNNFCLMSRMPAIGNSFVELHKGYELENKCYFNGGYSGPLPRLFRNKLGLKVDSSYNKDFQDYLNEKWREYKINHPNSSFREYIEFRNSAIKDTECLLYNKLTNKHKL